MTNYFRNARILIESPIKPGGIALVKILALNFYIEKWKKIINSLMIFYIPLLFCYLELFFQTLLKNITFLFDEFPQVADCMFPVFIFSLVINTNLKFVAINLWCFLQIFLNVSGFLGKPYEIIQLTLRMYGLFLAPIIGHVIASYLKLLNNMTEFFLLILNIIIKTQSLFFKWKK